MAGSNAVARGVPRRIIQGEGPIVPVIAAGAIPTIQYSTGNARALQQFSRDMFSVSNNFQDQLDQQVEAEATTQGALAGASGDFDLKNYGTIRGRAFNKAAVETFAATIDTRSIMKLNELQSQFGNDPDRLQAEWNNWTSGVSSELMSVSPEQAVSFQNRSAVRGIGAVEQAKDAAYALTRSQADAALIENEAALRSEVRRVSADLFSENPERAQAAASAIGQVQADYMKIYSATDPATGRPLYSVEEIAKAKKAFADVTMTQATLQWFDEQPDKVGAYMKFIDGDFKFKINTTPGNAKVIYGNQNSTRNDPLKPQLEQQLTAAASALGNGIDIVVQSGGQETVEEVRAGRGARTGSHRHDHGGAGDVKLRVNGKVVTPSENRELYLKFAEAAAAAGVTGIGIHGSYIHLGGGSKAAWGYGPKGGKGEYLPADFKAAIDRGYAGQRLDSEPSSREVPLIEILSEGALSGLDAEMRSRITFANQMTDRAATQQNAAITARQEAKAFDLTARVFAAGAIDPATKQPLPPLTREEVMASVNRQDITPADGEAIIKAMATEKPETSDPETYRDILARIYDGEDMYRMIIEAGPQLSRSDASELLTKNQTQVRGKAGEFSNEQKFYFDALKGRLGQSGLYDDFDQGKADRAAAAYDEYRRRVLDPEEKLSPREVSSEIAERASAEGVELDSSKLSRLVMPRFSTQIEGQNRLDLKASAQALFNAHQSGQISQEQFQIEQARLIEWAKLQQQVDRATKPKGK